LKRGTVHGFAAKFHKKGTLQRTKNPAFTKPGFMEPEWLYGLPAAVVTDLSPQMQHNVGNQEQRGDYTE
jgi:hypothetical protein